MLAVLWATILGNPIARAVAGALGLLLTVLVAVRYLNWSAARRGAAEERVRSHEADLDHARDLRRRGDAAARVLRRDVPVIYRD